MESGLALELQIAPVQRFAEIAGLDCGEDGAAGLARVGAVGDAAVEGKGENVVEGLIDRFGGAEQAEFAHAPGIDEDGAVVEEEEVAPGRGVNAFAGGADGSRVQRVASEEPVDKGGFADAEGGQESVRFDGREEGADGVQAAAGLVA